MKKKAHSIDIIFMLVLFSVFAIMSVLLILIGSNVYGKIATSQEINGNNRTVLSYITNKVRACQVEDGVYLEEKDGTKVLVIVSLEGEEAYETLIFENNGRIKEATIVSGDDYNLEFGDVLTEVSEFSMELNAVTGVLKLTVGTKDETSSVDVYTGNR